MNTSHQGHRYTHGHSHSVLRSHRWRTAEKSAAYLLPHLLPGQRLTDHLIADAERRIAELHAVLADLKSETKRCDLPGR